MKVKENNVMTNLERPLYQAANDELIAHIAKRIKSKEPSFLTPLNILLKESGQLAFILNYLINAGSKEAFHKSFFCNSHVEAVHGAIKLARHFLKQKDSASTGQVLVLDSSEYYKGLFNPLNLPDDDALIPGIQVESKIENILPILKTGDFKILVVSTDDVHDKNLLAIQEHCQESSVITILDISRIRVLTQIAGAEPLLHKYDIICWGESFTNFQVPFGAFSAKDQVFKVWNNYNYCQLHSTTFGGNGMVLSYAVENVLSFFLNTSQFAVYEYLCSQLKVSSVIDTIDFRYYLNAFTNVKFKSAGIKSTFDQAHGSYLFNHHFQNGLMDCVGGSGCNVFGHNNEKLISAVLDQHDLSINYFDRLNNKLSAATGLKKMIQAVSGASAVEIALTVALLANTKRNKILIFKGNFGGKTLSALNTTSANHYFFLPLYKHVEVFDCMAPKAVERLTELLEKKEISLVWFEVIQGGGLSAVPKEILFLINSLKTRSGYLIGIDEILNGIYRGGGFTSFDKRIITPDFITFAKALSMMTLPISVLMCSEEVFNKAKANNLELTGNLSTRYINQLSCHIGDYLLDNINDENIPEHVDRISNRLRSELLPLSNGSNLIKGFRIHGLHIHIDLRMDKFPFKYFGYDKSNLILTELLYTKGSLLSFFGRLLPALNSTEGQVQQIVNAVRRVSRYHPLFYFVLGLRQSFRRCMELFTLKNSSR